MANSVFLHQQAQNGAASPTLTPRSSAAANPDHTLSPVLPNIGALTRQIPRRAQGFRSLTGLAFSTSASSPAANNTCAGSRTSSISSTASRLMSFSKYRSRRLSDDSLTDLSPPTHLDLGHPLCSSPSLLDVPESDLPTTPTKRIRNSFAPTTASTSSYQKFATAPRKSSRDPHPAAMTLFRSDSSTSSIASRLRQLSAKSVVDKSACAQTPKTSAHDSGVFSFKRKDAKRPVKVEYTKSPSRASQEFESIRSPPGHDLRIVADPSSSYRSAGAINVGHGGRASPYMRDLNRSTSSPNLTFPTPSFSYRPSVESDESRNSRSSFGSPKRGKVPPPIKVPRLKANAIAIAVGCNSSPTLVAPKLTSRHRPSGSDGTVMDRRFAGLDWSAYTRNESLRINRSPDVVARRDAGSNEHGSPVDIFEALATTASPRSVHISLSNPQKVNMDHFPIVKPLQPAPRRLSGHSHQSGAETRGRTLPLFISKHSRTLGSTPVPSHTRHLTSPGTGPEVLGVPSDRDNSPTSAESARIIPVSKRISAVNSRCPPPPRRVSLVCHPGASASIVSRNEIPFPTSAPPVDPETPPPASCTSPATSDISKYGKYEGCAREDHPRTAGTSYSGNFPERNSGAISRANNASVASFDIRNLPLHFDTSGDCAPPVPTIAIPKPISIPQLTPMGLSETTDSNSKPNISPPPSQLGLSVSTIRPQDRNGLRSVRSDLSNASSVEINRCMNRIFTPASSSASDFSAHGSLAHIGNRVYMSPSGPRIRSLSADDHPVSSSHANFDISSPTSKRSTRPRSMSDHGPDREEIMLELFGNLRDFGLQRRRNLPNLYVRSNPFCALSIFGLTPSPKSQVWATRSIEQETRESSPAHLKKIVDLALKAYHPDSHRFVVGDVKKMIDEAHECEKKAKELHVRYLGDLAKREKMLQRHVMTLRAFNGDKGARFGESLAKVVSQSDQLASELLALFDHTSRIERICEANWRAAATVQMSMLTLKEAKLEASQAHIEQLEAERRGHLDQITELQAKLNALQDQRRPSSRSTDTGSEESGSTTSAPHASKLSQEGVVFQNSFASYSPSSTPRISNFAFNNHNHHIPHHQQANWKPEARGRFNSAHCIPFSENTPEISPLSVLRRETNALIHRGQNHHDSARDALPSLSSRSSVGDHNSPKAISTYTHCPGPSPNVQFERFRDSGTQASIKGRSESNASKISLSPKKSHHHSSVNQAVNSLPNVGLTASRIDCTRPKKPGMQLGLARSPFATNNALRHKVPISSLPYRTNRSCSFTSVESPHCVVSPGHCHHPSLSDMKHFQVNSPSSSFLGVPTARTPRNGGELTKYCTMGATSEGIAADAKSDLPLSLHSNRGTPPTLSRFPPQAPPPPSLPLPTEPARRKAKWSQDSSSGNLCSITLSQLGSMDIANLLTDLELSTDVTSEV